MCTLPESTLLVSILALYGGSFSSCLFFFLTCVTLWSRCLLWNAIWYLILLWGLLKSAINKNHFSSGNSLEPKWFKDDANHLYLVSSEPSILSYIFQEICILHLDLFIKNWLEFCVWFSREIGKKIVHIQEIKDFMYWYSCSFLCVVSSVKALGIHRGLPEPSKCIRRLYLLGHKDFFLFIPSD